MLITKLHYKRFYRCLWFIIGFFVIIIGFEQASHALRREAVEIVRVLPKDTIPAIKYPSFVPTYQARLDDKEPVIGITIDGESRAYSLYLLNHHEIVNDTFKGKPIVVTWCPLANLAVAYSSEIKGKEYTFGVSGKLLKNTLVMFDYETNSLWPIVYGEAIRGRLSGKKLEKGIDYQKMSWGTWKKLHPDTLVLSYNGRNTVGFDSYEDYHMSEDTGIRTVKNKDKRLDAKSRVIGIEIQGKHKAYQIRDLYNAKMISDDFHGTYLLIYANKATESVRVYDRELNGSTLSFSSDITNGFVTDTTTNTTWNLETGVGIEGSLEGGSLELLHFLDVYWFVWADYYPDTEIWNP